MRLHSLEISGFRGFATKQILDLNADAIVVVGANGKGKTSIFDAILWAISGRVERLGNEDAFLACKFSETGQTRVTLRMGLGTTPSLSITRLFDGTATRVSVETRDGIAYGPEAEGRIIQHLWKDAAAAPDPVSAVSTMFTRSVYLQQDLVRSFIDSATPQERYKAVSDLVGIGRVSELQVELERAKRAWTLVTNASKAEMSTALSRLSAMEARLVDLRARSSRITSNVSDQRWSAWWRRIEYLGLDIVPAAIDAWDAGTAVSTAITRLEASKQQLERRRRAIEELKASGASAINREAPNIESARRDVDALRERVDASRRALLSEQSRAADTRRMQAELKETTAQLQTLASIALKHLGETCPVCDQTYDLAGTRARLLAMVEMSSHLGATVDNEAAVRLAAEALSQDERRLAHAESVLHDDEVEIRRLAAEDENIRRRLAELSLHQGNSTEEMMDGLAKELATIHDRFTDVAQAQEEGEALALGLSLSGDRAAAIELERSVVAMRERALADSAAVERRDAVGDRAQRIVEALREAGSHIVSERIREIEPLLTDIYSRIDPHPAFRAVRFFISTLRGRGHLDAIVTDPTLGVESNAPATVLSSSQLNALAVCTFLSFNLGTSNRPLQSVLLDDPLQSLDDINLLGLIDLLRRTKDRRQLIVSTHDHRFGDLLARKLRPRSSEQSARLISLDRWDRTGPSIGIREIQADPTPLRFLAAS